MARLASIPSVVLIATLAVAGLARAAEPPVRPDMVARARGWTELAPDAALYVVHNLRAAEIRELIARGPDDGIVLALIALGRTGDAADLLGPMVAGASAAAVRRLAMAAAATKDAALAELLLERLADGGVRERRAILEAVAAAKPDGAENAVLEVLRDAETPGEKAVLLLALTELATDGSVAPVSDLLADEDPNVRRLAAGALRRTESDDALAAIVKRTKAEPDPVARREMELAVAALGGPREREQCEACLASPRSRLDRAQCLEALSLCSDPAAASSIAGILASDRSDLRREAAMYLGSRSEPAAPTALLAAIAKEEDPIVFRFEAASLARLQEKRAAAPLEAALADPNLSFFAALALAELEDPAGTDILREAAGDPELWDRAVAALVRLEDAKVADIIFEEYDELDARQKTAALHALLKLRKD